MENNKNKKELGEVGEELFAKRQTVSSQPLSTENSDKNLPRETKVTQKGQISRENQVTNDGMLQNVSRSIVKKSSSKNKIDPVISHKHQKSTGRSERMYLELPRRTAIIGFVVIGLVLIALCTAFAYSYSGNSIKHISQMKESGRSSSLEYVIVYSEADAWGEEVADKLRELFWQKTGVNLKVVSDSESVSRHEIRVGHTNRSGDDYITTLAALGKDGYSVLLQSGENVALAALSEVGAKTAVKYFVDSYVGAYLNGKLTLSRNMSISFVSRDGSEPSISLRNTKVPLNFSENGKFKILVLSDADINPNTLEAIEAIARTENPSLVMFVGDASSGMTTKAELEEYIGTLVAPLEKNGIPWAVVFGEQDTDGGLSAQEQMEVYSSFKYCVAKGEHISDGALSYFLPVYPAGDIVNGSVPAFGIWAMGQTPMLSAIGGASSESLLSQERENGTDYGYVNASHISWFCESQRVLDREAGGKMPTVMITHTPVPEFSIIAENPVETRMLGNYGEKVSSSPINSGLFAALLDSKNVLGLYVGHDHLNSFSGRYCGIELGYTASIGYDGYGLGGTFDINNSLRGGRIVELTMKDEGVSLFSRMVYASDYGIGLN